MTIVANDSLTLSKVNDGTITHTAWSYSADGTDRFTTVYPNLNLLKGTKTPKSITGNNTVNQALLLYSFDNNSALNNQGFSVNDTVTLKFDWSATNPVSGQFNLQWMGAPWSRITPVIKPSSTNRSGHVKYTFNIRAVDIASTAVATGIEYRFDNVPTNTVITFSNVIISKSKTSQPWMPSASEVTTADWPSYIGQYSNFMQADSINPSDYTWSLMRGNDGKDGADGTDGVAGKDGKGIKATAITYQASTNGTTAPTGTWSASVPTVAKGSFLWTRTIWTYTDNTTETGYAVAYMGTNGNNGTNGIAGKDGVGIKTTTITYVGSTSGTTAPTSGWTATVPTVAAGQYLWTKTVWAYTDNTSETGYSVARMGLKGDKGDKGNNGTNGVAGKDGKGIKATAITYQASTNGTTAPTGTWSASVPTVAKGSFLWTRTIWTYTDNTTETGYAVAYMGTNGNNGTNGIAGKDGVGIKTTTITYVGSTSGTTAPTSGWTATVPTVAAGQYLWTKTVWAYTDNTSETGYSVARMGLKGDKGDKGNNGTNGVAGKDGKGIKATAITYQASTNGTTAPTGTWSASVPTVAKGSFLWTRTIWTYTDNTTETGYAVAYMGTNGNNGTNGLAGKDGVGIKTTTITYVGSTSGTTAPTSGWTSAVPTVAAGSYLWTKTVWAYTDNTSETGYSVARMGLKGDKGDPGIKGSNGTSGIIVSSVAPTSPKTGQLWQDSSTTPQLVKKWTGASWVIWELYAQNLKADSLSSLSADLGDITGGTLKLMDGINVNGTLKKYGIYQSKFGLLSSGPALSTTSTLSNSQMGVANLNKGELRFMVTDYTENLESVQASGISDPNNAFIKFDSYENGKDVMIIGSSGDIVFKGITSQDTPWIPMLNGTYYKNMFSRVYISYSLKATSNANISLGVLPVGLRPFRGLHLTANAWGTTLGNDRHIEVRTTGEVTLYNPANGASYDGEVSFTI